MGRRRVISTRCDSVGGLGLGQSDVAKDETVNVRGSGTLPNSYDLVNRRISGRLTSPAFAKTSDPLS